jgi:hypothetical protein
MGYEKGGEVVGIMGAVYYIFENRIHVFRRRLRDDPDHST